jgi:mono/diheme cytochrome c family protein
LATGKLVAQLLLAGTLVATTFVANAQEEPGNPAAGRTFARQVCSPCHVVTPDRNLPRMLDIAPDFQAIANTSGMTATALRAFLTTSHPKMPNLILSSEQSADVIAYILSLKARHP